MIVSSGVRQMARNLLAREFVCSNAKFQILDVFWPDKKIFLFSFAFSSWSIQFIQIIPSDPISVQYQLSSSLKATAAAQLFRVDVITPQSMMRRRGADQRIRSTVDRYRETNAPWQGSPLFALVVPRVTAPPFDHYSPCRSWLDCTTTIHVLCMYTHLFHFHGIIFFGKKLRNILCVHISLQIKKWSPFSLGKKLIQTYL